MRRYSVVRQLGFGTNCYEILVVRADRLQRQHDSLGNRSYCIRTTFSYETLKRESLGMLGFFVLRYPPPFQSLRNVDEVLVALSVLVTSPTDLLQRMSWLPRTR